MKEVCMVWLFGLLRLLQWNLSYKIKRRFPFHCQTRFCRILGWRIPPICYIYIHIRKLNFLGSLFWRGFGEVLERDLGDQKLQKHCVLQCFLIATIKIPKVFLGFSTFGEGSGSPKYWKCCVLQWFLIATIEKPIFSIGFSMFFSSGDLLSINFFIVRCNGRLLTSNESISDYVFTSTA